MLPRAHADDPHDGAAALRGLARLARERHALADAEALARSALVPRKPQADADAQSDSASERADTLLELAETQRALGRHDDARASCSEALALTDMSFGADSTRSAAALLCLGRVQWARGEAVAARLHLTRAVALLDRGQVAPQVRAGAHEALSIALHDLDRARADALAQRAAADYLAAGPAYAPDHARALARVGAAR